MKNMMIVNRHAERRMKRKGNRFVGGAVLATVVLLISAVAASAGGVVYENIFDGANRGDNPGIGGGMDRALGAGPVWELDTNTNQLLGNARSGTNDRGNVFTVNSFDLTGGFRLVLVFSIDNLSTGNAANRVNFGIAATDHGYENNYLAQYLCGGRNTYGIGLNMTTDYGPHGLNYVIDEAAGDGQEAIFNLSNDQTILGGGATQTLVLEVNGTGTTWSYSLDGEKATTGTFADAGVPDFDFTRRYQIFGWVQRAENDIKIDSVKLTVAPGDQATTPDPAYAERFVAVDLSDRIVPGALSWEAPTAEDIFEVLGYNLYMDPNESKVLNATPASTDLEFISLESGGQTGISFDPGVDLDYDTTYFWRVDSIVDLESVPGSDPNTLTGRTWTFTTVPESPVIYVQPDDQIASPGESVLFSVSADNPLGGSMDYSWYYSEDDVFEPTSDILVSGPVTDDDTLTVSLAADTATAVFGQQGYYYCVVDNGVQTQSEAAYLKVNHLIAHYALDGNANDSSIYGYDGFWPNPALESYNTTDPVIGSGSVVFAGTDPNSYIDLGTAAAPNPQMAQNYGQGSISFWFNTTSTDSMVVFGSANDGVTSNVSVTVNNGALALYLRSEAGVGGGVLNIQTASNSALVDGQWHHVALAWEDGAAVAYIDGEVVPLTYNVVESPVLGDWQYPMAVGARNNRGTIDSYFVGELDELKMYNYRLTELDVYDQYLAGPTDWVCVDPPAMDFNGDCIVDLADFALFAERWLECGRYPDTQCQP